MREAGPPTLSPASLSVERLPVPTLTSTARWRRCEIGRGWSSYSSDSSYLALAHPSFTPSAFPILMTMSLRGTLRWFSAWCWQVGPWARPSATSLAQQLSRSTWCRGAGGTYRRGTPAGWGPGGSALLLYLWPRSLSLPCWLSFLRDYLPRRTQTPRGWRSCRQRSPAVPGTTSGTLSTAARDL